MDCTDRIRTNNLLINERGMSLIVLLFAITILSTFAIGLGLILTAKFHSYPHVAKAYQAQALADAGVEFAMRYARDNPDFGTTPASPYIPAPGNDPNNPVWKKFSFGNGEFWLNYVPSTGCQPGKGGTLTCRGVVGTATREVKIPDFVGFAWRAASSARYTEAPADWTGGKPTALYISGGITKTAYVSVPGVYYGDQISFSFCDDSAYKRGQYDTVNEPYYGWIEEGRLVPSSDPPVGPMGNSLPIRIAATKVGASQVTIMRVGVVGDLGLRWMWDGACELSACSGGAYTGKKSTIPWDGTTVPPPLSQFVAMDLNTSGVEMTDDVHCRPQTPSCPTTCPPTPGGTDSPCTDCTSGNYTVCNGKPRSEYTCGVPYNLPIPTCWGTYPQSYYYYRGALPFVIQALGPIPSGTKFYVSFWTRPHYRAIDIGTYWHNQLQVQTQVVFTVP